MVYSRILPAKEEARHYPYLGIGTQTGTIVLWQGPTVGVILVPGNRENKACKMGTILTHKDADKNFEPYIGEITLSNQRMSL